MLMKGKDLDQSAITSQRGKVGLQRGVRDYGLAQVHANCEEG